MTFLRFIACLILFAPLAVWAQSGPGGVGKSDLELWLKANRGVSTDNNGNVTTWADSSGNGNNATPPGDAPELKSSNSSIGGKPTISFDASNNEYLELGSKVSTGSGGKVTVFIVFNPNSSVNSSTNQQTLLARDGNISNKGFVTFGNSNSANNATLTFGRDNGSSDEGHYYNQNISTGYLIHNFDSDGSNANYYQDNKDESSNLSPFNSGFSGSQNFNRIGANANTSNHLDGEIAEIIIYSKQLGTEERELVANYLDAKYQLNGLASGDIFSQDGTYHYDPAGITANYRNSTKGGGLDLNDYQGNLAASDDVVFAAHENSQGVNTSASPNRWKRNWQIEFSNVTNSDRIQLIFDADDYFGPGSHIPSGANGNDYELLEKGSQSGNYSSAQLANGKKSIDATNDQVIFEPKFNDLNSGNYYTLGTTDATNSPLPVEWQYFEGKANGQQNLLKWGTASETNARHFKVQRAASADEDFQTIATIQAAGTTIEPQEYRYTDAVSNSQTHYYRLKQVDFDGSYEYSNVIALGGKGEQGEAQLRLTQNPVREGQPIRYQFENAGKQPITVKLFDARGQQRYQQRVSAQEGAQALRPDNLSPGVYWLQIQSAKQSFSRKVVIY